jgi:polysaccharide biosynthesis protein PslJ
MILRGYLSRSRIQEGLTHRNPWVRGLTIVALCLAAGVPTGAILGLLGPLYGSAALIILGLGYLTLRDTLVGLLAIVGIVCLLPFATLPVNIGFAPTFLDVALLATFFVWISRLVTYEDREFITSAPTLGVLIFVILATVSFVAGLSHAQLTANVVRHFVEILLSVLIFVLIINTVRSMRQLRVLVLALILAGFAAALIGVVLYFLPPMLTVRILSALRVVRYPTGLDVLRYIEDNPEFPLRATSTSVDPNVLGGMLIFVTPLAAAQVMAHKPILSRWMCIVILATMFLCILLTFSRSSLVGLGVAVLIMGLLRYRRIFAIILVVGALLLLLPPAQVYVQHFTAGVLNFSTGVQGASVDSQTGDVQGPDLATQMRLGEYKDAFNLISRYPWFGVGFAGTPEIDTYLGVSSVYLLIAEEMGLVGLAAFLSTLVAFLIRFFAAVSHCPKDSELEPILLGTCLAVAGALVAGTLDHYLFNLDFPHAAALLWLMVGLGTVSIRLAHAE